MCFLSRKKAFERSQQLIGTLLSRYSRNVYCFCSWRERGGAPMEEVDAVHSSLPLFCPSWLLCLPDHTHTTKRHQVPTSIQWTGPGSDRLIIIAASDNLPSKVQKSSGQRVWDQFSTVAPNGFCGSQVTYRPGLGCGQPIQSDLAAMGPSIDYTHHARGVNTFHRREGWQFFYLLLWLPDARNHDIL